MSNTITVFLGSVEPKAFQKFENGRMFTYCYSIKRDRAGVELSRTEPEKISSIGYDDGTPFTKSEHDRIMSGEPRMSALKNVFNRISKWMN